MSDNAPIIRCPRPPDGRAGYLRLEADGEFLERVAKLHGQRWYHARIRTDEELRDLVRAEAAKINYAGAALLKLDRIYGHELDNIAGLFGLRRSTEGTGWLPLGKELDELAWSKHRMQRRIVDGSRDEEAVGEARMWRAS